MKTLTQTDIKFVSGAGSDIYIFHDVKFNQLPMKYLPILMKLTDNCVNQKWDVGQFTKEMQKAGINSSLYTVESQFEFENEYYKYS